MSTLSKIGKAVSDVGKFMGRYADEASNIADALRMFLPALPIGDADKAKVLDTINKLDAVADSIGDYLTKNPDVGTVTVKKSDVEAAVARWLEANPDAIAAAIQASNTDAAGNGDA